eukprot:1161092-Pelagomonas_calceolata.AAC.5
MGRQRWRGACGTACPAVYFCNTRTQGKTCAHLRWEGRDGGVHAVLRVQQQWGDSRSSHSVKQGDVQAVAERPAARRNTLQRV